MIVGRYIRVFCRSSSRVKNYGPYLRHLISLMPENLNYCDDEIMSVAAPRYHMDSFGLSWRRPQQTALVITGTISHKMAPALPHHDQNNASVGSSSSKVQFKSPLYDKNNNRSGLTSLSKDKKFVAGAAHPSLGSLKRSKSLGAADALKLMEAEASLAYYFPKFTEYHLFPTKMHDFIQQAVQTANKMSDKDKIVLARLVVEHATKDNKYSLPASKLCAIIMEKDKSGAFSDSLVNTCQMLYEKKETSFTGDSKFTSFLAFLTEIFSELKRSKLQIKMFSDPITPPKITLLILISRCCEDILLQKETHSLPEITALPVLSSRVNQFGSIYRRIPLFQFLNSNGPVFGRNFYTNSRILFRGIHLSSQISRQCHRSSETASQSDLLQKQVVRNTILEQTNSKITNLLANHIEVAEKLRVELQKVTEEKEALVRQNEILRKDVEMRQKPLILLALRSRIEHLEAKFLPKKMQHASRKNKWMSILTSEDRHYVDNEECINFRKNVEVSNTVFSNTVVDLYGDFSHRGAHKIDFYVECDESEVLKLLKTLGMCHDLARVNTIYSLLKPIPVKITKK